mmetsp:Transcript_79812/g.222182  ORF Transcript_79812/g.222182 Transcript_79812/m.222182 type:complete len:231 (-) Transcript_79812:2271-2963(-)
MWPPDWFRPFGPDTGPSPTCGPLAFARINWCSCPRRARCNCSEQDTCPSPIVFEWSAPAKQDRAASRGRIPALSLLRRRRIGARVSLGAVAVGAVRVRPTALAPLARLARGRPEISRRRAILKLVQRLAAGPSMAMVILWQRAVVVAIWRWTAGPGRLAWSVAIIPWRRAAIISRRHVSPIAIVFAWVWWSVLTVVVPIMGVSARRPAVVFQRWPRRRVPGVHTHRRRPM